MAAKKKVAPSTDAPTDETKRKFREALAAKQGRASEGEAHTNLAPGDSHAHGPVDAKRTFRRKTG
jgi:hypothetical protein